MILRERMSGQRCLVMLARAMLMEASWANKGEYVSFQKVNIVLFMTSERFNQVMCLPNFSKAEWIRDQFESVSVVRFFTYSQLKQRFLYTFNFYNSKNMETTKYSSIEEWLHIHCALLQLQKRTSKCSLHLYEKIQYILLNKTRYKTI